MYDTRKSRATTATIPRVSQSIETEVRDASTARVPAVSPGHAILFTRYDEEKSVVVHPDDYRRLASLEAELASLVFGGAELSALAAEAHRLEDTPGEPIEDADAIRRYLGL